MENSLIEWNWPERNIKYLLTYDQVGFISAMQSWFNSKQLTDILDHINRIRTMEWSLFLTDTEKPFHRIQNPFMILKNLSADQECNGTYSIWQGASIKSLQITSHLRVNYGMLPPWSGLVERRPLSALPFSFVLLAFSQRIKRRSNKGSEIRKEVTLLLLTGNVIMHK